MNIDRVHQLQEKASEAIATCEMLLGDKYIRTEAPDGTPVILFNLERFSDFADAVIATGELLRDIADLLKDMEL